MTDEEKQKRKETSQFYARQWEQFMREHCKRGHYSTVARAVTLGGLQLRDLGKDKFNRDEFMLEIDRIVLEMEITAEWFWRDR